jgi:hypothetical protein
MRPFGRRAIDDELERIVLIAQAAAMPVAVGASLAVVVCGLYWGTFAASSVDAFGYVSEAALWARGRLRIDQPFVASIPWPAADLGIRADGLSPCGPGHAIVPSYAPGLPLLMALAERLAGACGPYYVVPLLGGLCVWCCYLLGRRAASAAAGPVPPCCWRAARRFLFHLVAR